MTASSLFAPLRVLAIASVVGTAVLAGSLGPVSAQSADSSKTPAAAAATSNKPETVEQRIDSLKLSLKITADQDAKWNGVATAMRENAAAMDKLVKDKQGKMATLNAVDDLKTYQEFSQANLDGLKNLNAAFIALYDSMPAAQKANADKVFESFGPAKG